jgi:hypothetical protein
MNTNGNKKDVNKMMGKKKFKYYTYQFHYKENVFVEPVIVARETSEHSLNTTAVICFTYITVCTLSLQKAQYI